MCMLRWALVRIGVTFFILLSTVLASCDNKKSLTYTTDGWSAKTDELHWSCTFIMNNEDIVALIISGDYPAVSWDLENYKAITDRKQIDLPKLNGQVLVLAPDYTWQPILGISALELYNDGIGNISNGKFGNHNLLEDYAHLEESEGIWDQPYWDKLKAALREHAWGQEN